MAQYKVVGEGETVEILGVLRAPGDLLKLIPKDAEPHVADGSLVEVPEEVPVAEAPAGGDTPVTEDNGITSAPTPESEGGSVETAKTETEVAQPTGESTPVAEPVATPEPATGTEQAQPESAQQ